METKPETYIGTKMVMSNYDHSIDLEVAGKLRNGNFFSQYSGWNFCGIVWFCQKNKKWYCEVWVHHCHTETISADNLKDIMKLVSDKYGAD